MTDVVGYQEASSTKKELLVCVPNPDQTVRCSVDGNRLDLPDVPFADFEALDNPGSRGCVVTTAQALVCWVFAYDSGEDVVSLVELGAPAGPFAKFALFAQVFIFEGGDGDHGGYLNVYCGLRADRSLACWVFADDSGEYAYDSGVELGVPAGPFTEIRHFPVWDYERLRLGHVFCGWRSDRSAACWAWDALSEDYLSLVELGAPAGPFTEVRSASSWSRASGHRVVYCGLRSDRSVACWRWAYDFGEGGYSVVELGAPAGPFTEIIEAADGFCGLRSDRSVACWVLDYDSDEDGYSVVELGAPAGPFTEIIEAAGGSCGLRSDRSLACWHWDSGESVVELGVPAGPFTEVIASAGVFCGLRSDRSVACWVLDYDSDEDGYRVVELGVPAGPFTEVIASAGVFCGLRSDRSVACWVLDYYFSEGGYRVVELVELGAPVGPFTEILEIRGGFCGLRSDRSVACWAWEASQVFGEVDYYLAEFDVPAGLFA